MKYLTAEEILIIHAEMIDQIGGLHGVREINLLQSAAHRAKTSYSGHELYKTVFDKAGAYLQSLAMYHVFLDGNKRTAIAASARFLDLNGYELEVSNKEMESFVLDVVVKKLEITEIAKWLKKHSREKPKNGKGLKKKS